MLGSAIISRMQWHEGKWWRFAWSRSRATVIYDWDGRWTRLFGRLWFLTRRIVRSRAGR
jgi:hypothetical protein